MPTTIQISDIIRKRLEAMKMYAKESYNDVIERILEDEQELNSKTKKEIEEASKRIRSGKGIDHNKIMQAFG